MRRHIRRTARTNDARTAGENGSIALEAAMVMPVFLMLVFFLLFLVKTAVIAMSLHGVLSQTVRLAAASWYPVSLIQSDPGSGKYDDVREAVGGLGEWLPSPLKEWADNLAGGSWTLEGEAAKLSFRQLALQLSDTRVLEADKFSIVAVGFPQKGKPEEAYLTLEAEYRLPFRVPFTGRSLVIRSKARERAWVGGSPSRAVSKDEEAGSLNVSFVSLEPNPVRPGRKATLILRTTPGAVLDLSVLYKSGHSQAKHLGRAVADASGIVTWTWHVSGNTASGQWNWEVTGDGGSTFSMPFQVERSSGRGGQSP